MFSVELLQDQVLIHVDRSWARVEDPEDPGAGGVGAREECMHHGSRAEDERTRGSGLDSQPL